jgi:hypothetical protein
VRAGAPGRARCDRGRLWLGQVHPAQSLHAKPPTRTKLVLLPCSRANNPGSCSRANQPWVLLTCHQPWALLTRHQPWALLTRHQPWALLTRHQPWAMLALVAMLTRPSCPASLPSSLPTGPLVLAALLTPILSSSLPTGPVALVARLTRPAVEPVRAQLALRFYHPTSGSLTLDGTDVLDLPGTSRAEVQLPLLPTPPP